jgi:hypothetical protein
MFFSATAQYSVVAYPHKPLGQYMQCKPADEFFIIQGHCGFLAPVAIVFDREAHALFQAFNPVVGDSYFVGVAPQVFNHLFGPIKGWFAIYHPFLGKELFIETDCFCGLSS